MTTIRPRLRLAWGVLLAVLAGILPAHAQDVPSLVLDGSQSSYSADTALEVFRDPTGTASFESIRQHAPFEPAPEGLRRADALPGVYWLRLRVRRTAPAAAWWLSTSADSLVLYAPRADGTWDTSVTGVMLPLGQRDVPRARPAAAALYLPPDTTITLYARLAHDFASYRSSDRPLAFRFQEARSTSEVLIRRDYLQGLFAGLLLALGLYNLFLFVTVRSMPYLYYVLAMLAWALYWTTLYDYHLHLGWPGVWPVIHTANFAAVLVIIAAHLLFTASLLGTHQRAPRLHLILLALLGIICAAGVLGVLGIWDLAQYAAAGTALAYVPASLAAGILTYRQGYRPAHYYLIACAAMFVCVTVYTLTWLGVFPVTDFARYSLQVGVAMEALLLSLALGDRIRFLQDAVQRATSQRDHAEAATHALREANELKTELLSIAAHDLRNPLTHIVGYAEVLDDDLPTHVQREPLQIIQQAARRMTALLNDLLNTAAIESGKIDLHVGIVDFASLVEGVTTAYQPHAERKGQMLKVAVQSAHVFVEADEARLREAIDNIISNAVKYTPLEGHICVRVRQVGNHAQLEVEDTGPGITEADQRRLFERFQRLSARPTAGESSTGLGLSITKHIVERHGGRIWVESELGVGSTFVVELPVHVPTRPRARLPV